MKLRTKLIVLSLLACILPMGILLPRLYASVRRNVGEQAESFCYYNAQNLAALLDRAFDAAYEMSLAVIANEPVRAYLDLDWSGLSPGQLESLREDAFNALYTIRGMNEYVSSVTVCATDGRKLCIGRNGVLFAADRARADGLDGMYFWGMDEAGLMKGQPFLCRLLRDGQHVREHWGYVKVYLYADKLLQLLAGDEGKGLRCALADADGRILLRGDGSAADGFPDGYTRIRGLAHAPWQAIAHLDAGYVYSAGGDMLATLRIGVALMLLAAGILSMALSRMVLRPFRRMAEAMEAVGSGRFGTHIEPGSRDEVGALAVSLNRMSDQLKRLCDEAVENRTLFLRAKLRALQSQINPHFLYNTLDNIRWMCEMRRQPEISRMVSSLSQLFKLSLSADETGLWPLSREILHIRCYLDILRVRCQDSVDFTLTIQPGLEALEVPALMLQPLVENALQHGIQDVEHGDIRVEIEREEACLVYRVRDNGQADAQAINQLIRGGPPPGSRKGFALQNLHERLQLHLGPKASLLCRSTPEGSLFELRIPLGKEEGPGDPPVYRG